MAKQQISTKEREAIEAISELTGKKMHQVMREVIGIQQKTGLSRRRIVAELLERVNPQSAVGKDDRWAFEWLVNSWRYLTTQERYSVAGYAARLWGDRDIKHHTPKNPPLQIVDFRANAKGGR